MNRHLKGLVLWLWGNFEVFQAVDFNVHRCSQIESPVGVKTGNLFLFSYLIYRQTLQKIKEKCSVAA